MFTGTMGNQFGQENPKKLQILMRSQAIGEGPIKAFLAEG
jgi:hypothetical protein